MLAYMLVGHMVGDYLLQNDWQALNKKKASWPCFVHCFLYTLAIYISSFFTLPLWAIAIVFITHFAQDRTAFIPWFMKWKGSAKFKEFMDPWASIIVDNSLHVLVLGIISAIVYR